MSSSNCEIVERDGCHVDLDRLVLAARGLLIAFTVNSFHRMLSRHCNMNSRDRRVPDWHPSLPRATRLSVAVEPHFQSTTQLFPAESNMKLASPWRGWHRDFCAGRQHETRLHQSSGWDYQ
jgi:hypothetical protein